MKYLMIFVLILVLAGVGGGLWYNHMKAANANPLADLSTAKVDRGDLRLSVATNGVVASNKDVDIKVRASGEIIKLPVDISQEVKKGELLMELDTKDQEPPLKEAQAQVDSDKAHVKSAQLNADLSAMQLKTETIRANANLASAKAQLADANSKAGRTEALYQKQLASKEDLETAQTTAAQMAANEQLCEAAVAELDQQKVTVDMRKQDIVTAQAALDQDQARLDLEQQAMDYTKVYSPIDGTVSDLTVQIGNIVQSSISNVSGGTAVMTISDLSHIFVMASVDESDVGQVRLDQPVRITSDSYPGVEFTGKVVRIATKGVNTSNVVTFEVKIEVTSPNKRLLKPVMTTNVEIIAAERDNVLMIPMLAFTRKKSDSSQQDASEMPATSSAATQQAEGADAGATGGRRRSAGRPQEGTVTVVRDDGTQEVRNVVVGMNDRASYEVISGLSEGETVLLNPVTDSRFKNNGRRGRSGASQLMRIGR
ncbi:MAG TPA: efflux RND transporter periplasmic adaptor subunit [Acidobacteriaceae bacterium]|nr:efflux RND transporter periplasmic adaptor subunit [Acidobacteriaceae bacterium]